MARSPQSTWCEAGCADDLGDCVESRCSIRSAGCSMSRAPAPQRQSSPKYLPKLMHSPTVHLLGMATSLQLSHQAVRRPSDPASNLEQVGCIDLKRRCSALEPATLDQIVDGCPCSFTRSGPLIGCTVDLGQATPQFA